jgi:hypothetical protein
LLQALTKEEKEAKAEKKKAKKKAKLVAKHSKLTGAKLAKAEAKAEKKQVRAEVKAKAAAAAQQQALEGGLRVSGFPTRTARSEALGVTLELSTFNGVYTHLPGDDTIGGFPVWRRGVGDEERFLYMGNQQKYWIFNSTLTPDSPTRWAKEMRMPDKAVGELLGPLQVAKGRPWGVFDGMDVVDMTLTMETVSRAESSRERIRRMEAAATMRRSRMLQLVDRVDSLSTQMLKLEPEPVGFEPEPEPEPESLPEGVPPK